MAKPPKNDLPLMSSDEGIVMFYPHVPKNAKAYVCDTLDSRWIGQGPKVEQFETAFRAKLGLPGSCVAVGSGTDALHLSYLLAGIKAGDEVLAPVFTCTATNIPLLYIGADVRFVDADPNTLNISIADLKSKISDRTRAIVCVHYGGLPCDMEAIGVLASQYGIPVIEDAAQALGASYAGAPIGAISDFTIFSFQAVKHLTTGNSGMLTFGNADLEQKARRLRWFGIDRTQKQKGTWENDITEVGYKYEMTDIEAAIGLAGLEELDDTLAYRRSLYRRYVENLRDVSHVKIIDDLDPIKRHAAWLFTISVERRLQCQLKLRSRRIESGQAHFRNDRYSIFGCSEEFPGMDAIDDNYLILPLHTKMSLADVDLICDVLRKAGDLE
jgi:perosamine synthetase